MQTDIFTLPDMFVGGTPPDSYIHFYTASQSSRNNKVRFTQNVIVFMLSGTKEIITPLSTAKVEAGNFIMLNAGSVLMSEKLSPPSNYESIILFFDNTFLTEFCVENAIQTITLDRKVKDLYLFNNDAFVNNYLQSLTLLEKAGGIGLFKIKMQEILLYLKNSYPLQISAFINQSFKDNSFSKIKQVVLENSYKGLSIGELAFLANMSVSSFKRHFATVFNTSPQKYFIDVKMHRAKKLLLANKGPSDIYLELGYENLSSFSKEFKKYYGMPPGHIKKQLS